MLITEDQIRKPLKFYVMDVGEGLMLLIVFPDGTTMMYDCNIRDVDEDGIIEQLKCLIPLRKNQQFIDVFVNSHRDADHFRGLKKVNEFFLICRIWDSGQTGNSVNSLDYQYYMRLRRKVGYDIPVPSFNPYVSIRGASVYCLSSSEHIVRENESDFVTEALKIQHTNTIVLSIRYGRSSILLTGDSDWYAWKYYIVPQFSKNLMESTVLIASHHGSKSFLTDEANDTIDIKSNPDTTYLDALKYIRPQITLISCGDYLKHHHPNEEAVSQYTIYTEDGNVHSTYDYGTFFGNLYYSGKYSLDCG